MSGQEILRALWSMKWLALAILLVFLGLTAAVTALLPKTYEASGTIRVIPSGENQDTFNQLQASQALARTYTELFKRSASVYTNAVDREGLPISPGDLQKNTNISYIEGTELLQVQVQAPDPSQASYWADTVAQTFIEEQHSTGSERLVLADAGALPAYQVSPSWRVNMALALLLGIVAAVGTVLLIGYFSDRISSEKSSKN